MSTLQELIERKEAAEAELSAVKAEIAARHGETDETLDPDPAKAEEAPAEEAAAEETTEEA